MPVLFYEEAHRLGVEGVPQGQQAGSGGEGQQVAQAGLALQVGDYPSGEDISRQHEACGGDGDVGELRFNSRQEVVVGISQQEESCHAEGLAGDGPYVAHHGVEHQQGPEYRREEPESQGESGVGGLSPALAAYEPVENCPGEVEVLSLYPA